MLAAKEKKTDLMIDVGPLSSIAQLTAFIARPLQRFTAAWLAQSKTRVIWDLRRLRAGAINPSALAAFCASARRLRQFAWTRPLAYAPDLNAQRFLHGIGFFDVARQDDLFEFPPSAIGGYRVPAFHPATHIFCIRRMAEMVPSTDDPETLGDWKDQCREEFRQQMLYSHDCYRLFVPEQLPHPLAPEIVNAILNCCAEFATNAVLWGRADAFVAVQVGKERLSATVCDAGEGLRRTLCDKRSGRLPSEPADDHEATFFASIFNRRAMGLFHTIWTVLKRGGSVQISSGISEIRWQPALWRRVAMALEKTPRWVFSAEGARTLLGPVTRGRASDEQHAAGLRREWKPGLRGTRILFELPYDNTNR